VETCRAEGIRIEHRRDALIRYCETWALWRECVDGIWSEGQVVQCVSPDGVRENRRNPRMVDQAQLSRLLYQCGSELGLSAKARLEILPGDGTDGSEGTDGTTPAERRVVYKIRV
jgi:P27 family predicted phage terminase small subunit